MSQNALKTLSLLALMCAGALGVGVTPAFACHEATGWCCIEGDNGHPYCCYFQNDQLVKSSCGPLEA
jgi:hypothetical protein